MEEGLLPGYAMSIAVLSDIHSNLYALNAVLGDLPAGVHEIWFLGDLFGYGPHPQQVVDKLQQCKVTAWLAGNHDLGLVDKKYADKVTNKDIKVSWELNRKALKTGIIEEVASKPKQETLERSGIKAYLYHGFPSEDEEERVTLYDFKQAPLKNGYNGNGDRLVEFWRRNTPDVRLFLVGHSHRRTGWKWDGSGWGYLNDQPFGTAPDGTEVENTEKSRSFSLPLSPAGEETFYLLNPGSVGMPNDGCGKGKRRRYAKYMLMDISPEEIAVEYRAVEYNYKDLKEEWMSYPASIRGKLNLE
jgi:predicted phosphodiesterase